MAHRQVAVMVVSLCGVEPRVWRRFRVPVAIRLDRLHWAIQAVMGWEGVQDYEFELAGRRYQSPAAKDAGDGAPVTDVRKTTLAKLEPRLGVPFRYRYHMSESWEHDVVLEALDWEDSDTFVCTDGAMVRPSEDADFDPPAFSPSIATHILRLLASAGVLGEYA